MTRTTHLEPASTGSVTRSKWAALAVLSVAQLMVVLDTTIVNVALPSIQEDLHFKSEADLQWVVNAYVLTAGGFLLLGGRVADRYGRRLVFVSGIVVFAAASLSCGLANSPALLVGSRAVQGLGAAFMAPAALSLLTVIFAEGEERNRALGVWSAIAGAGGAVGLLAGGVLTTAAVVAVGVLRQPADRRLRRRGLVPADRREPRPRRRRLRRARRRDGHGRAGSAWSSPSCGPTCGAGVRRRRYWSWPRRPSC